MPRKNNNTRPENIESRERAARAIELRKEGKTYDEIAAEVGYKSKQSAYDAVKRSMREIIREPAEELLELELARLDSMFGIHYLNARAGDVQALAACMKLMERRAKLLGLDAPAETKTELFGPDGKPIEFPSLIQIVGVLPKPIDDSSANTAAG